MNIRHARRHVTGFESRDMWGSQGIVLFRIDQNTLRTCLGLAKLFKASRAQGLCWGWMARPNLSKNFRLDFFSNQSPT